jgi:hypothetical protein
VVGYVQAGLSKVLCARKERRMSMTILYVATSAFLGFYAHLQYQLLCGPDHYRVKNFDVLGVSIFFSMAIRLRNIQICETMQKHSNSTKH